MGSQENGQNWKAIEQYSFTEDEYNAAVQYLKLGTFPAELLLKKGDMSIKKKRYKFRKRMADFELNSKNQIIIQRNDISNHHKDENGKLMFPSGDGSRKITYTVIRPSFRQNVLEKMTSGRKDDLSVLALSAYPVFKKIRDNYNLLNINYKYVKDYLKNRADIVRELRVPSLRPVVKSYRPLRPRQIWQMDTIHLKRDEIARDNDNYQYVLVIIDIFSKYVYVKKIKSTLSTEVADHLEKIFHLGDIPEVIMSDNGPEFIGDRLKILLTKFNVKHRFTPSYSPQTNGFAENKNKLVKALLFMYFVRQNKQKATQPFKYIDILYKISFTINSSIHSTTKLTPIQVHFGINILFNSNNYNLDWISDVFTIKKVPKQSIGDINFTDLKGIEYETIENTYDNSRDIKKYVQENKKSSRVRDAHVAQSISKKADKREDKQNRTDPKLQVKSFVKIKTFIGQNQCDSTYVNPLWIQWYKNEKMSELQPEIPVLLKDHYKKQSRQIFRYALMPKVYSAIYIVYERNEEYKTSPSYILKPYIASTGQILKNISVRFIRNKFEKQFEFKFSDKFRHEMLHHLNVIDVKNIMTHNKQHDDGVRRIIFPKQLTSSIQKYHMLVDVPETQDEYDKVKQKTLKTIQTSSEYTIYVVERTILQNVHIILLFTKAEMMIPKHIYEFIKTEQTEIVNMLRQTEIKFKYNNEDIMHLGHYSSTNDDSTNALFTSVHMKSDSGSTNVNRPYLLTFFRNVKFGSTVNRDYYYGFDEFTMLEKQINIRMFKMKNNAYLKKLLKILYRVENYKNIFINKEVSVKLNNAIQYFKIEKPQSTGDRDYWKIKNTTGASKTFNIVLDLDKYRYNIKNNLEWRFEDRSIESIVTEYNSYMYTVK